MQNRRPEIFWQQAAPGVHVEGLSHLQAASIRHHQYIAVIVSRLSICFEKSGEDLAELYGVWNGDFTEPLQARQKILVDRILDANFLFKKK
jgi:hypothetical protein